MSEHKVIESDLADLKSKLASVIAEGFSDVVMSCFEALCEAIRSSFAGDDTPCSEDSTESERDAGTDTSVNDNDDAYAYTSVNDVDSVTDEDDTEVEGQ